MLAGSRRRMDAATPPFTQLARMNARLLEPSDALARGVPVDLILVAAVWDSLCLSLFGNVASAIRTTAPRTTNEIPWYGQQEAHRVALYDVFRRLRHVRHCQEDLALLAVAAAIVRSTGWWWGFDGICVLAERPVTLQTEPTAVGVHNERWLHGGTGPAVEFTDGSRVFAHHGVVVPDWVVLDPTVERIAREPDPVIRRCAIERLGWERYLDEASLRLVDADPDARLYTDGGRQLLAVGEPAEAALYVPSTTRSARDALAWTRGLRGVSR